MAKSLFISEKPSVAQEFAKALKVNFKRNNGYLESEGYIVTWCVGHLITMSYPEVYDPALKKWSFETLPFIPKEFKYEVIPAVKEQYNVVKTLLLRQDVDKIYVCTDSGREGEYIYRLVDDMAGVPDTKEKRRVWIDSQTEEEILKGIKNAKELKEYDSLSDSAYLRAKEDYLMGINFSRVLTLKYGNVIKSFLKTDKSTAISVGRVMTCVLGMVVRREREIRAFVKTPFYRVLMNVNIKDKNFDAEFRAVEGSKYFNSPKLYKENGFKEKKDAQGFINELKNNVPEAVIAAIEKKKEIKNPPLLYNLAELQNDCSKMFKISPDQTLKAVQELYEKKLVTYPRTDARVLSTAVAKEIDKNIKGIKNVTGFAVFVDEVLKSGSYKNIAKTRYTNDKLITDHYAIIPTGQGFSALSSLSDLLKNIYFAIVRRFLSIFYPPAVYQKISLTLQNGGESFFANFKVLSEEGYLKAAGIKKDNSSKTEEKKKKEAAQKDKDNGTESEKDNKETEEETYDIEFFEVIKQLKKGDKLLINDYVIKEGETAPPKRYNSGSLILAMENAGQLIEDEELRAQIKGSGIGTSATRAEILNKLVKIDYLKLNKKTQVITPALTGEMIYDVVNASIKSLLNAELTASWEKGLTYVSEGTITKDEYMSKLDSFIRKLTKGVIGLNNQSVLMQCFNETKKFY